MNWVAFGKSGPVVAKFCKGKSFTEDPSNGNEEESKKEETLTVCETSLRMGHEFNQPLRRSTS
jgi:hypothetical protein